MREEKQQPKMPDIIEAIFDLVAAILFFTYAKGNTLFILDYQEYSFCCYWYRSHYSVCDIRKCKWIPYDENGRSNYHFLWLLPSCNIIQQNKAKSWIADDSKDMCVYVDHCNGSSTVVLIN